MRISFVCAAIAFAFSSAVIANAKTKKVADFFNAGPQRALAEAAGHGRSDEIEKLLSSGAVINFQARDGMTALIWALLQQNKNGYQYLLERGADPNLQMPESTLTSDGLIDGNSAMSLAAMHEDSWWLEVTLKHGGNANIRNPVKDVTPIFQCIMLPYLPDPHPRLEQLKMLIAAGADLNARNGDDNTPLMYAVRLNRYDMAYLLLQAGADPALKTKWDSTVVYEIKESRLDPSTDLYKIWRPKVIEFLKTKGIDVVNGK